MRSQCVSHSRAPLIAGTVAHASLFTAAGVRSHCFSVASYLVPTFVGDFVSHVTRRAQRLCVTHFPLALASLCVTLSSLRFARVSRIPFMCHTFRCSLLECVSHCCGRLLGRLRRSSVTRSTVRFRTTCHTFSSRLRRAAPAPGTKSPDPAVRAELGASSYSCWKLSEAH